MFVFFPSPSPCISHTPSGSVNNIAKEWGPQQWRQGNKVPQLSNQVITSWLHNVINNKVHIVIRADCKDLISQHLSIWVLIHNNSSCHHYNPYLRIWNYAKCHNTFLSWGRRSLFFLWTFSNSRTAYGKILKQNSQLTRIVPFYPRQKKKGGGWRVWYRFGIRTFYV